MEWELLPLSICKDTKSVRGHLYKMVLLGALLCSFVPFRSYSYDELLYHIWSSLTPCMLSADTIHGDG